MELVHNTIKVVLFIGLSCHLQSVKAEKLSEGFCLGVRFQNAGLLFKRGHFAEN